MDCTTNINTTNMDFISHYEIAFYDLVYNRSKQIKICHTAGSLSSGKHETYIMHVIQGFHHSIFTYSNTFFKKELKNGLFTLPGAKQMFLGSENFCFVFISCTARFFVNFENLRNISICKPDIQTIFSRSSESTKMARWLNIENDIKKLVNQITGFQVLM